MSVIKKKPAIDEIVERLSATQLATLKAALNSTAFETYKSYVNESYSFADVTADSPTDIAAYQLQMDAQKTRNGIAIRIYKSAKVYEHFLVYGESQKITIYELDSAHRTYKLIEEYCDINELRRVCDETQESGGDEWVIKMKEHLDYSAASEGHVAKVECGTNLEVDGALYVNSNVGEVITQSNFLENSHVDITISDFSAYKFGQLVILHLKYTTTSLAPNEKLFDIKSAYRPVKQSVRVAVRDNGTIVGTKIATSGRVDNLTTISSTGTDVYIDFIYEI